MLYANNCYKPKSSKVKKQQRKQQQLANEQRQMRRKFAEECHKGDFKFVNKMEVRNLDKIVNKKDILPVVIDAPIVPTDEDAAMEYAKRDAIAKEKAELLKSCLAPAYNKGAYQPVLTKEQAEWIGRK